MDTAEVVEDILKHHGVLGMKWGVHRSGGSGSSSSEVSVKTRSGSQHKTIIKTKGGKGLPAHPDAIAAKVVTQKLKKSGMHTLSNAELQNLATRTNLESQIHRSGVGQGTFEKGYAHTTKFLSTPQGKEAISSVSKLVTSEAGQKATRKIFKGAALAAAASAAR